MSDSNHATCESCKRCNCGDPCCTYAGPLAVRQCPTCLEKIAKELGVQFSRG